MAALQSEKIKSLKKKSEKIKKKNANYHAKSKRSPTTFVEVLYQSFFKISRRLKITCIYQRKILPIVNFNLLNWGIA